MIKKLLLLLFSASLFAQITPPPPINAGGTATEIRQFNGGLNAVKRFKIPFVNTDYWTPESGCLRLNSATGRLEAHNGTSWVTYAPAGDLAGYATQSNLDDAVESLQQFTISGVQDLPTDFIVIGGTGDGVLNYKTDTYRTFNLQPYVGTTITNISEIVRNGNDLFFVANFSLTATGESLFITVKDCKIINNQLVPGLVTFRSIPINTPHGLVYNRGFCYISDRPASGTVAVSSRLVKLNPYDLADLKVKADFDALFGDGYYRRAPNVIAYKNKLYMLFNNPFLASGSAPAKLVEIDENMVDARVIATYGNGSGVGFKKMASGAEFVIYNDEIIVPTWTQGSATTFSAIGIVVFDMEGNIKRQTVTDFVVNLGAPTLVGTPHWMTVFNDKLLLTLMQSTNHKQLIRINPGYGTNSASITLEEFVIMPTYATDDLSLTRDGDIYVLGEPAGGIPTQLVKYKYNDFSTYTTEIANLNTGAGGYAMINPQVYKEAIKAAVGTNLSWTASATNGILFSDTGADATIFPANSVYAGLLLPSEKIILSNTSGTNTGDNVQATPSTSGIARLYTTTGSNNNGSIDQATLTALLNLKAALNASNIYTAGTQTYNGSLFWGTNNAFNIGSTTAAANTIYSYSFVSPSGLNFNTLAAGISFGTLGTTTWQVSSDGKTVFSTISGNVNLGNSTFLWGQGWFNGRVNVATAPVNPNDVVRDIDLQFTKPSFVSVTSAYTTGTARTIVANGTFPISLATTGIPDGMDYYIENIGTGTITIQVVGGGTIEGMASKTNNVQWSGMTFVKTGSNYIVKN